MPGLALVLEGCSRGEAAALNGMDRQTLRDMADLALAMWLEQIDGNLSINDPALARAKPIAGMTGCIGSLQRPRLSSPASSRAPTA